MPLYAYKCPACGAAFDRLLKLEHYNKPQTCSCGELAVKQLCAPAVFGDFEAYNCPITGKRIEGRKAHEANLRLHGCRVLEPGETEAAAKAAKVQEEQFEDMIVETAVKEVLAMPKDKQVLLGQSMESHEVAVIRQ